MLTDLLPRRLARLAATAATAATTTLFCTTPAHAVGALTDVQVIDRTTGQTLPVFWHGGKHWVAGTPGNRYAIALHNRSQGRVLTVISVDGVNAVSGETANWDQTGYVLTPWRSAQITGWRKSSSRVAAFEFTALDNSYAARTGRPDHVGVIGVAVFRERPRPDAVPLAPPATPAPWPRAPGSFGMSRSNEAGSGAAQDAARASAPEAAAESRRAPSDALADAEGVRAERPRDAARLGTGHGRQETSRITYTDFERARAAPDEIVTIHYDSHANLVAMGVIARTWPAPQPQPFPGSQLGYVPDPPR
jgi:hypothetical protein